MRQDLEVIERLTRVETKLDDLTYKVNTMAQNNVIKDVAKLKAQMGTIRWIGGAVAVGIISLAVAIVSHVI